jgi:hypothetical protein
MNRLLAVALLVTSVLVGYFSRPPVVQAQPSSFGFPYRVGDSIEITYADGAGTRSCVIERFFGAFVSCRTPDRPFGPKTRPWVYNLSTSVSVTLATQTDGR